MAYIKTLFNQNFLEYASYVIKDRAIPHVNDGFKPVQRRIVHSLFEMHDGKFHKVANVVGHCMKYHPHGDASIYSALVVLANKEMLIDKQGNFGNILTGDEASAARYIECRLQNFASDILYNPEITEYEPSYDGRGKEPVTFPCKIPLLLIQGAEGIAVGMSTRILPHNYIEVMQAVRRALRGEMTQLYPDFLSGGIVDVSGYEDGMGKVLVRAKLDVSDPKKIIIKEIPYGTTTESLITSVENAAKKGKIKISQINDFTTEEVEIEIKLPRGVHSDEVVDALFAFTDCEMSIAVNLLVIKDRLPVLMTVTEIIAHHAKQLVDVLKAELELEKKQLLDKLHARTLERIFIEERIYKRIEKAKTREGIYRTVYTGFEPYTDELLRPLTDEDIERLLKIPIRRISLYDINKARQEIEEINARLKEVEHHLGHLTEYAEDFIDHLLEKSAKNRERKTKIASFDKVDVRNAAERNLKLRYDKKTGYLGYSVTTGDLCCEVSQYDRILMIEKTGSYSVIDVPEKLFVGKGLLYVGLADKETMASVVFTVVYRNEENKIAYIKRCRIEKYILQKKYDLVPEGGKLLKFTTKEDVAAAVEYQPKPLMRVLDDLFPVSDFRIKGVRAAGVRLGNKEIRVLRFIKAKK